MRNNHTTHRNRMHEKIRKQSKRKPRISRSIVKPTPTKQTIEVVQYEPFEHKVEDIFRAKKIDIVKTSYNLQNDIVENLKKAVMNETNIKAENDFYTHINSNWIDSQQHVTDNDTQYIVKKDDFRIVQHTVYKEITEIMKIHDASNSASASFCDAYKSFSHYDTNLQTRRDTNVFINKLNECKDMGQTGVWELLAFFNSNEIIAGGAPFKWSINPSEKDPHKYVCFIEQPSLTLNSFIDVYFVTNKTTNKYKKMFLAYINQLFTLVFGKHHGYNPRDVFDVEVELLLAMACSETKTTTDSIHTITSEQAITDFNFDWPQFCSRLGFKSDDIPDKFYTTNLNYLLCGTRLLLSNWTTDKWTTYWIYQYIKQQTRWNINGRIIFFQFYGKFMMGQQQPVPMDISITFPMCYLFHSFLHNQYIQSRDIAKEIQYTQAMAEDLRIVFSRVIQRNKWMQPSTKATALRKIQNLTFRIGSEFEDETDDPMLHYSPTEAWNNLCKMAAWRHELAVKMLYMPVKLMPAINWTSIPPTFVGNQSYVVNAYYSPTQNSIVIPHGYIQYPFIDLNERGIEYNLARIGFTIAHELSHVLDTVGKKYNEYGEYSQWWTKQDEQRFKKIQSGITKQYAAFAKRDNIKYNASFSINENIADISGLALCQEYLRDFQLTKQSILPIQSLSFKAFFVYYAVKSRQQMSNATIMAQLKSDAHPPDKYRCNIPLSRSNIFRAIFNIKKKDKMWWNSTNSVWG